MTPCIVPDAAVDVIQNWTEQDGAACAVRELDKVIDYFMKSLNADSEEILTHLRTVYFVRNEIAAFIPEDKEKGGES